MSEDNNAPFSRRHGYGPPDPEISIREEAPEWLREWLANLPGDTIPLQDMHSITRRLLPERPELRARNAGEEIRDGLEACEWYGVYDVAEGVYDRLAKLDNVWADQYEERLNKLLRERGVGWEMRSGRIFVRGSAPFEAATQEAFSALAEGNRPTAAREMQEALQDLSRRPEPDLSGAIHHAMAALECVARDIAGDTGSTLGKLIERHSEAIGIDPPLGQALTKLWGYASERGRHLREGREPSFEEVELVVIVAAAVSTYLTKKAHI